jgi:hypothetical protein
MQKTAWYKLILMPLMILFTPQSLRRAWQARCGLGTPSPLSDGHVRGYLAMWIASELPMGTWSPVQRKKPHGTSLYSCRERYRSLLGVCALRGSVYQNPQAYTAW